MKSRWARAATKVACSWRHGLTRARCGCGRARSGSSAKVAQAASAYTTAVTSIVTGTKCEAGSPRDCAHST